MYIGVVLYGHAGSVVVVTPAMQQNFVHQWQRTVENI
jgi:hypothetical protein